MWVVYNHQRFNFFYITVAGIHNAEFVLTGVFRQQIDHHSYRMNWMYLNRCEYCL